jgi:hypothetical protein
MARMVLEKGRLRADFGPYTYTSHATTAHVRSIAHFAVITERTIPAHTANLCR